MTNKISRFALLGVLWAFSLVLSGEVAHAQIFTPAEGMLSRDIQVEEYVKGQKVDSWPWVNYGTYYSTILQMAYDPVLPPVRWGLIRDLPDRLVVTERARDGKLLRRFDLSELSYLYTYRVFQDDYYRDTGHLANAIRESFTSLPSFGLDTVQKIPPILVTIYASNGSTARMVPEGGAMFSSLYDIIKLGLQRADHLDALEEMNLTQKFKGPGAIEISIRPDVPDLPDSIVLQEGQILVRQSDEVARGYIDRHNWRAEALAQRALYETWKSRGVTTVPRER